MISTNERLALQHRRNRKHKSELQASQEMVNAFDKISVSVRRAHNVNRCQQDHLDNTMWTLENEHRKSMGLLALEQRRFIRARKSSNVPVKPEQKNRKRRKLSGFSVFTENESVKTSRKVPTLVDQVQDGDSVKIPHCQVYGKRFVGSERRNFVQKQDFNKHVQLPSIQERTQLDKTKHYKGNDQFAIESCRDPAANKRRMPRNTGLRQDFTDKQRYVASWDISAVGKSYSHFDYKLPVRLPQSDADKAIKAKEFSISRNDYMIATENHDKNSNTAAGNTDANTGKKTTQSLANNKVSLIGTRGSTNTTSELESILDKTTEVRVKEFLKLPPIGGIHENPSLPEETDSGANELHPQSNSNRRLGRVNLDITRVEKPRAESSLWKNLVHCRYLRLGEEHTREHRITNKNCECNWCAMMRKSRK